MSRELSSELFPYTDKNVHNPQPSPPSSRSRLPPPPAPTTTVDLTKDDDDESECGTPPPKQSTSANAVAAAELLSRIEQQHQQQQQLPPPGAFSSTTAASSSSSLSRPNGFAGIPAVSQPYRNPLASASASVPGHPSTLGGFQSPGLSYAHQGSKRVPAFADTDRGRQQAQQYDERNSAGSRLPPPPRQPSNGGLPGPGQNSSLFVQSNVTHSVKTFQSRQPDQRAWKDEFGSYDYQPTPLKPVKQYVPPPASQQHQPHHYPQQPHARPDPYPSQYPSFPDFLPDSQQQQQQQQPRASTSSSHTNYIDVVSPSPEDHLSHDNRRSSAYSQSPELSANMPPPGYGRTPVQFGVTDPSAADRDPYASGSGSGSRSRGPGYGQQQEQQYDGRGRRVSNGPSYGGNGRGGGGGGGSRSGGGSRKAAKGPALGVGGAGWGGNGFNDDDDDAGGRGGGRSLGTSHQAAGAPKAQKKSGFGSGPGKMLLDKAMGQSVSMENRGGGQNRGKGKERARQEEEDDDDEVVVQRERTQKEAMAGMSRIAKKKSPDDFHHSPTAHNASLPAADFHPSTVSSSSFHSAPQPSTSTSNARRKAQRVIPQEGSDTDEMREGQRAMSAEAEKQGKGKGKGKGKKAAQLDIKGAAAAAKAQKAKPPEVLDLADSSDEEDEIEDDEPDEFGALLKQPMPGGAQKKSKRTLEFPTASPIPTFDDLANPVPSSPDQLGFVATQVNRINRQSAGGARGLATSMQPRKRPNDGGSATNQDDPVPSTSTSTMAAPPKSRGAPRASRAEVARNKKGKQAVNLGENVLEIPIRAPMFSRHGIPVSASRSKYLLKLNQRGNVRTHEITITSRSGGSDPQDIISFKLAQVMNVGFCHEAYNVESTKNPTSYYAFRLDNRWDRNAWEDVCHRLCEMDSAFQEEKTIHVLIDKTEIKTFDDQASVDELFHIAVSERWTDILPDSASKARGVLENYRQIWQQNKDLHDANEARARNGRSSTAGGASSSSKKKGEYGQTTLKFGAARPNLSLEDDADGDFVHPAPGGNAGATRSSSRPSTSHLAAPQNRRSSVRRNYLNESDDEDDDDDDGAVQVQDPRARPEPEPYAADEIVLEYPMERAAGQTSVALTYGDTKRLKDDEFLNDTLIEFGLKRAIDAVVEKDKELTEDQQLAPKTHVFNSFFYKQLSSGKGKKNPQQVGYSLVEKWTKKINLFDKKFIVVPINEHLHWYLAIIVNPSAILRPPKPPAEPARKSGRPSKPSARASGADGADTLSIASSSHPGSPAEDVTSRHFKPAASAEQQQDGQNGEDVEMQDAAERDEEDRVSKEHEREHLAAVAAKEGLAAIQDADGDHILAHSSDDEEITASRPDTVGGGPKRAGAVGSAGAATLAALQQQHAHGGSDTDEEPSTADSVVADSQEKQPPSAQPAKRVAPPAAHAAGETITLDSDDEDEVKKTPAPAPKPVSSSKKPVEQTKDFNGDGDVEMISAAQKEKDDDRASDTTRAEDDSDDAVQNRLRPSPPGQAQAGPSSSSAGPQKVVNTSAAPQGEKPAPRRAVPIVPSEPPDRDPQPRAAPPPPPTEDATTSLAKLDMDKISTAMEAVAADAERLNECYILIFDSLDAKHAEPIKYLKHYLGAEAKKKLNMTDDEVAHLEAIGIDVRLPMQPNFCDCGLYLLHFVEKFLDDPSRILSLAIALNDNPIGRAKQIKDARLANLRELWADDVAQAKRKAMREEVRGMSEHYMKDVKPELLKKQKEEEERRQEERRRRKEERSREQQEGEDANTQAAILASLQQEGQQPPAPAPPAAAPAEPPAPEPAKGKGKGKGKAKAATPPPALILSDDESLSPSPKKTNTAPLHPPPQPAAPAPAPAPAEQPSPNLTAAALSRPASLSDIISSTAADGQLAGDVPVNGAVSLGALLFPSDTAQPPTSQATALTSSRRATYGAESAGAPSRDETSDTDWLEKTFAEPGPPMSPTRSDRQQQPQKQQQAGSADFLPLSRLPSPSLLAHRRPRSSSPAPPPQDDKPASKRARRNSPPKPQLSSFDTSASDAPMPFGSGSSAPPSSLKPKGRASLAGKGPKPEKKVISATETAPEPTGFAVAAEDEEQEVEQQQQPTEVMELDDLADVNSSRSPTPQPYEPPPPGSFSRPHPSHPRHKGLRPPTPPKSSSKRAYPPPEAHAQTVSSSAPSSTADAGDVEESSPPPKKRKSKEGEKKPASGGGGKAKMVPYLDPAITSPKRASGASTNNGTRTTATAGGGTHTHFSSDLGAPPQAKPVGSSAFDGALGAVDAAAIEEEDDGDAAGGMQLPPSNQQAAGSSSSARVTRSQEKGKGKGEGKEEKEEVETLVLEDDDD
ncbi:hypothetical protein JCM6882_002089 [Rhodosporidiobolus microsporus]